MLYELIMFLQIIKRARQRYLMEEYLKRKEPLSKALKDTDDALVVSWLLVLLIYSVALLCRVFCMLCNITIFI